MAKKRRKPPRKRPASEAPKTAASLRALAQRVGKSASTVSGWLKRPDWPFPRRPPWHVAKVAEWSRLALAPNPAEVWQQARAQASAPDASAVDLVRLKLQTDVQLGIERVLLTRLKREERTGKLHAVAECRERRLRQIHVVKAALLDLARTLPPALEGQGAAEIGRLLLDRLEALCRTFAGDLADAAGESTR